MVPFEFILTDIHFAICLMAALACFATCWLYLDAWTGGHRLKEFLKWTGFGVLAFGFVVSATQVESAFLGQALFPYVDILGLVLRGLGYAVLAVGLALDPLEPVPEMKVSEEDLPPKHSDAATPAPKPAAPEVSLPAAVAGPVPTPTAPSSTPAAPGSVVVPVKSETGPLQGAPAGLAGGAGLAQALLPLLAGAVAFLYFRRATTGLERHLKPVVWAFAWFTAFELVDLAVLGRGTNDPRLYGIVAPFGPLWILGHALLFIAAVILGRWVWQYLTKRLQTQLFMVLTTACLVIFLVTTVSFTFLLMSRVRAATFESLDTTAKVLGTTIASKQAETVASSEVVAQNAAVATAVVAKDHNRLVQLMSKVLTDKNLSSVVITNESGLVLLRAEDPGNWGDSVSSDTLVARALVGRQTRGLSAAEGALAPRLIMKATTPIRNAAGVVVGTVTAGFTIDNAYVDGLKQTTGLASAIYSGSERVATTLLAPDGTSRSVGVKESRTDITKTVLEKNKTWSGVTTTNGQTYLAVYAPLRDADNAAVGMLFIGQPQVTLLQAAGRSIELTFLVAVLLLVIAIWPVHLISKSLVRQLR